MTLEDLRPAAGSTSKSKRVGRGRSSGHGKTSCRGHNGEGQRSGNSSKRGFEGGQMPAYRRLPKLKGFQVYNKLNYAQINVGRLDDLGMKEISLESLREKLTIHPSCVGLRVLGNGEIKSAVTVKASYVTPSAKEKIEAAGGKVELV
ncbi:MAG: 50S ribosomal protein L15 [Candidatus Gastranaerophilales bacterium]|nr:50S ribosomal protein L15 [Candidatus Gastranaerophilales bacterium]